MAASSLVASKLLNIQNSALRTLIRRHLLHSSAAILHPSTSNLLLLKNGSVKSPYHSSIVYSPRLRLGSSLMQIEAARTYATKDDRDSAEVYEDDDDEIDDDDDIEDYSGSDFDDSDEYVDSDDDRDAK